MRRGFLLYHDKLHDKPHDRGLLQLFLDARAQPSADQGLAAREHAKQMEWLMGIAWQRVRQLQLTTGAAIVVWFF